MSGPRVRFVLGAAVLVAGMAVLDTLVGGEGFGAADFAFELLDRGILVAAMAMVALGVVELREMRSEQRALRADLERAVASGARWREDSREVLADLGEAIQAQFDAWSLTRAEADIAGLVLKGVTLRDIAALRQTSETTIRQQAQSVYRKSGLSGRAEFAAYFLESLFEERNRQGLVNVA